MGIGWDNFIILSMRAENLSFETKDLELPQHYCVQAMETKDKRGGLYLHRVFLEQVLD